MDNLKMKSCSKCKSVKDMSFFVGVKNQETKTCKVCRDAGKRHRQKNKDNINAKNREKFVCPCGRVISNNHKSKHQYQSFTHIMYLKGVDEEKYKKFLKMHKDKYPETAEKNIKYQKQKEEEDTMVKEWMALYYGEL